MKSNNSSVPLSIRLDGFEYYYLHRQLQLRTLYQRTRGVIHLLASDKVCVVCKVPRTKEEIGLQALGIHGYLCLSF